MLVHQRVECVAKWEAAERSTSQASLGLRGWQTTSTRASVKPLRLAYGLGRSASFRISRYCPLFALTYTHIIALSLLKTQTYTHTHTRTHTHTYIGTDKQKQINKQINKQIYIYIYVKYWKISLSSHIRIIRFTLLIQHQPRLKKLAPQAKCSQDNTGYDVDVTWNRLISCK